MNSNLSSLSPRRVQQAFILAWALCFSMISFAWGHGPGFPTVGSVFKDKGGITIQVKNQNLFDVANAVEQASGIKITVAGHLNLDKITAEIHQPDWASAIRRLLANYSTVEIGSTPLLKVRILDQTNNMQIVDKGGPAISNNGKETLLKNGFVYRPVKRIKKKIWANENIPYSQDQLKLFLGDSFNSEIPQEVFHDIAYRGLLKRHKIDKPEDLAHLPKSMPAKMEAGKLLRVLQKRNY